jgi:transcription elongation factor GreA
MEQYFSVEDLEKLKKELEYLKTVKTKELAEQLRHAISFGDLSENAAYSEAKERQGFLHGKILEMEAIVRDAKIITNKQTSKVQVGSIVSVSMAGEKEKFKIVASGQVNSLEGKISYESPVGKILLGKSVGDRFDFEIGGEKIPCEILKIE